MTKRGKPESDPETQAKPVSISDVSFLKQSANSAQRPADAKNFPNIFDTR